jgi:hypothetical protein
MTDPLRLTQLGADMEFAELESRIVVAQEKAAVARRNTKLLELTSLTLDRKSGSRIVLTNQAPPLQSLQRRQDPLDVRIHLCWLGTRGPLDGPPVARPAHHSEPCSAALLHYV